MNKKFLYNINVINKNPNFIGYKVSFPIEKPYLP